MYVWATAWHITCNAQAGRWIEMCSALKPAIRKIQAAGRIEAYIGMGRAYRDTQAGRIEMAGNNYLARHRLACHR